MKQLTQAHDIIGGELQVAPPNNQPLSQNHTFVVWYCWLMLVINIELWCYCNKDLLFWPEMLDLYQFQSIVLFQSIVFGDTNYMYFG